jgi:hypothetical protein
MLHKIQLNDSEYVNLVELIAEIISLSKEQEESLYSLNEYLKTSKNVVFQEGQILIDAFEAWDLVKKYHNWHNLNCINSILKFDEFVVNSANG